MATTKRRTTTTKRKTAGGGQRRKKAVERPKLRLVTLSKALELLGACPTQVRRFSRYDESRNYSAALRIVRRDPEGWRWLLNRTSLERARKAGPEILRKAILGGWRFCLLRAALRSGAKVSSSRLLAHYHCADSGLLAPPATAAGWVRVLNATLASRKVRLLPMRRPTAK